MGRPPIGDVAMTAAERVRRHRLKRGADKPATGPKPIIAAQTSAAQRRYEAAIRERLRQEVYKELDHYVAYHKDRIERADRILANWKGVMSRDAFRKIKACLHPDHNTFALAAEALQIFSDLEKVLVKPDEPVRAHDGPPLPVTAAELMARRRRRS